MRKWMREPKGEERHVIIGVILFSILGIVMNTPWWLIWPCSIFGGLAVSETIVDIKDKPDDN